MLGHFLINLSCLWQIVFYNPTFRFISLMRINISWLKGFLFYIMFYMAWLTCVTPSPVLICYSAVNCLILIVLYFDIRQIKQKLPVFIVEYIFWSYSVFLYIVFDCNLCLSLIVLTLIKSFLSFLFLGFMFFFVIQHGFWLKYDFINALFLLALRILKNTTIDLKIFIFNSFKKLNFRFFIYLSITLSFLTLIIVINFLYFFDYSCWFTSFFDQIFKTWSTYVVDLTKNILFNILCCLKFICKLWTIYYHPVQPRSNWYLLQHHFSTSINNSFQFNLKGEFMNYLSLRQPTVSYSSSFKSLGNYELNKNCLTSTQNFKGYSLTNYLENFFNNHKNALSPLNHNDLLRIDELINDDIKYQAKSLSSVNFNKYKVKLSNNNLFYSQIVFPASVRISPEVMPDREVDHAPLEDFLEELLRVYE